MIKNKKMQYREIEGKQMAEQARSDLFKALRVRQPCFPHEIGIETWIQHLSKVLSSKETRPVNTGKGEARDEESIRPFTQQEVAKVINYKEQESCGTQRDL
jgi:hypothetical protein